MNVVENPYRAPETSREIADMARRQPLRDNRPAMFAFALSLVFPICVLICTAAMFREDSFSPPRWRVHRSLRRVLFYSSLFAPTAAAASLIALRWRPRLLAIYGLLVGTLGSTYIVLVLLGFVRR